MLFRLTALVLILAVVSDAHKKRFLFGQQGGTTLESVLPDECTYLSEFEDVLSITNKWIKNGEYLYSELLRIRIRELRHISLDDVENGYRYLLELWKGNKSTEFHEAILSTEYTNQFHHSICLNMLEYLINTFLKDHQGEVCAQYLRLPRNEQGPNPVKCSPVQLAITITTVKPTTTTERPTSTPTKPTTTTLKPTTTITTTTIKPTTTTKMPTTTTKPTTTQTKPTEVPTTSKPTTTPQKPTTTTTKVPTTSLKPTTKTTTEEPTTTKITTPPTMASTLTTQQSTIPTTPNPNLSCAVCNNTDCRNDESDLQYCSSLNEYCLTSILDDATSRQVSRRCVDRSFCVQDLQNNGGYKAFCFMADGGEFGFDYECNFCCTSGKCNAGPGLIPDQHNLFQSS